ncbi:MAG: PKD domain-containing protein [bacterium]
MKRTAVLTIAICALLVGSPRGQDLFLMPEGVVYDTANQRYLVSNWGNGCIIQVDEYNRQTTFKGGLINGAGLHIEGNVLYVACHNQNLVGIDLTTAQTVIDTQVSDYGFHDVTADTSGFLYATDWNNACVYRIQLSDYSFEVFEVGYSFASPMGILFDARNNRLLVTDDGAVNSVIAITLHDTTATPVWSSGFPVNDDIVYDGGGYYYISTFDEDTAVIRIDTGFVGPPKAICGGYGLMTDLCYNVDEDILGVTHYANNSFELIQMKVGVVTDTGLGWVPFDVNFEGSCESEVLQWIWDFGDGDFGTEQAVTHTYTFPGLFDISLQVITTDNDTLSRTIRHAVGALADTLRADSIGVLPDSSIDITIYAANHLPLDQLTVPVEFGGSLNLNPYAVGWSTVGCRTEYMGSQEIQHYDPAHKRMTFRFSSTGESEPLPPGGGPVLMLHFEATGTMAVGQSTPILLDGYTSHLPAFDGPVLRYQPVVQSGAATVISCCQGVAGNIDDDPEELIVITDLVYLVNYMFNAGPPLPCMEEANVNGSIFSAPDIEDLVYLVSYMFQGGPEPAACP